MRRSILFIYCCILSVLCYAQAPQDFVIPVKVKVAADASFITLEWPEYPTALAYRIKRKIVGDSSYKEPFLLIDSFTTNASVETKFTDFNIAKGILYEYELSGSFSDSFPGVKSTYVCAGSNIPAVHKRGSMVLLCENGIAAQLTAELGRLYQDLVGDGWKVIRINVPGAENATPWQVKSQILTAYQQNPDLKQVLIIGHVAVPYSGSIDPDGHTNHWGCWPADGYYGAMNGNWTDTSTGYFVSTTRPENINLPGDGKFDRNYLPAVQLAVGRVDLRNLPAFNMDEAALLARYLTKNHLFRNGETQINRQALIEDNFPTFTEKFSQSAWKSYAAIVGYDNVFNGQYETDLQSSVGYLWSYGAGGGVYAGASGLCSTNDYVTSTYKTVFTQLFGSYFGDWDSQDNLMRASLASPGNTLTCVWGGRPHWYFHHMAAGLPIGYSTLLTMNNTGTYNNLGNQSRLVHIGLMGDPTLRSSYIKPLKRLAVTADTASIHLKWPASAEAPVIGYFVYKSHSIDGDFVLLNETPLPDTSFTDNSPFAGNNVYMVRAAKSDTLITMGSYTNSSSYQNLSAGIFDSITFARPVAPPAVYLVPILAPGNSIDAKQVVIQGNDNKRYFVGEKNGDVKLYDSALNLIGTYLSVPGINEGFFSMAFDPAFDENKLLYVFYTSADGGLLLSRFREDESTSTATFQQRLIKIPAGDATKNLGGEIHFGTDGYLYISTGDGDTKDALLNNAQNNSSLLGKILRILPKDTEIPPYYSIPPNNPYGNEVFASGLRFPYRWNFDRLTNEVYIGDRGDSSIEEVNSISFASLNGANFGWPCYEGANPFNLASCSASPEVDYPFYTYPSPGMGSSVTGGTVYRGETFISLKGYYIFADANGDNIYLSKYDSLTRSYLTFAQPAVPGGISDISEDSNGELYATSLLGGIYKIEADGPKAYHFVGHGNWDVPSNWLNKIIPPSVLPEGSAIIISPADGGECILNVPQTIGAGSKLIVEDNRSFRVPGNLTVQ